RVLITGGGSQTAEIFDPATGTFSNVANPMTANRSGHVAVALSDGTVLLAGGFASGTGVMNTAGIFDGSTFGSTKGSMPTGVTSASALLLGDGEVLTAGGDSCNDDCRSNAASTFDPATGLFTATAGMVQTRIAPSVVRLPNGTVLVAGGFG